MGAFIVGRRFQYVGTAFDPRSAELDEFLTSLSPWKELATRMAMLGFYELLRRDPEWRRRVDGLMESMSPDELAEIHKEAHRLAERLKAEAARSP